MNHNRLIREELCDVWISLQASIGSKARCIHKSSSHIEIAKPFSLQEQQI